MAIYTLKCQCDIYAWWNVDFEICKKIVRIQCIIADAPESDICHLIFLRFFSHHIYITYTYAQTQY